jgi:hypothetical protein
MSWVTENRKHRDESDPCPIVADLDNYHFELRCEDCDVSRMSRLSLVQVEDLHYQGRLTQDDFEAYGYVHALLSPYSGAPTVPTIPAVRRIARKLLAARSFDVPSELAD